MNNVEIKVKICKKCSDYREITITKSSGEKIEYRGDDYHNNINTFQKSYIQALTDFNFNVKLTEEKIDCMFNCD